MATVKDVNEAFVDKGLSIELPYPSDWLVKKIDILEKKDTSENVGVLLALKLVDDNGKELSELYYGESSITRERKTRDFKLEIPSKDEMLPLRPVMDFNNDEEAEAYIRKSFTHLLKDKGYEVWGDNFSQTVDSSVLSLLDAGEVDMYAEKKGRGFFIMFSLRSDEEDGYSKASKLVALRKKHSNVYDFGLVMPAFQQSLGISWRAQENWLTINNQFLSTHRIGLFAVDNLDPNRLYPLTIYTKERELFKYMVNASRQWSVVRGRYLQQRTAKAKSGEPKTGSQ